MAIRPANLRYEPRSVESPDRVGDAGCDAGAVRRLGEVRRAARIVVGDGQRTSCVACVGGLEVKSLLVAEGF